MRNAVLSLGLLAALVGGVRAGEEEIEVKSLPKAVTKAVKAKFPEAKITKAIKEEDDGKVTYEVVLKDDGSNISLSVTPKGKILEIERPIEVEKLPKAVRATLSAKYPNAKIKSAEEVLKFKADADEDDEGDKPTKTYEVVLSSKGKEDVEVKLSAAGKVIEKDEKSRKEKDEEDEKSRKKTEKKDDGPGREKR